MLKHLVYTEGDKCQWHFARPEYLSKLLPDTWRGRDPAEASFTEIVTQLHYALTELQKKNL